MSENLLFTSSLSYNICKRLSHHYFQLLMVSRLLSSPLHLDLKNFLHYLFFEPCVERITLFPFHIITEYPVLISLVTTFLSSPLFLTTCPSKIFFPLLFLNCMVFFHWIAAAHSSAQPNGCIRSNLPSTVWHI